MSRSPGDGLAVNIRSYPWYAVTFNAFAWMPVFFLFFDEQVSLAQVLQLEAIYYATVVVLEVPSGYASDAFGRKRTIIVSVLALLAAYATFLVGRSFATLALAQSLLAAGIAFNSGTDTAFHLDSLAAAGREDEYGEREAVVARNGFWSMALAALVGGAVATFELRWAYAVSLAATVVSLLIVLRWTEPPVERGSTRGRHLGAQLRLCLVDLSRTGLRWLFGFAVLMTVLNHVPYEFYQPYIDLALQRDEGERWSPMVAGAHSMAAMLLGAVVAARSIRWRDRIGTARLLLAAAALQTLIIVTMGAWLHAAIIPVLLLRVLPRALSAAPLNAAIVPRVPSGRRATYLSLQSLAGRLAFSLVLFGLSTAAGAAAAATRDRMSRMLLLAAALGAIGFLALLVTAPRGLDAQPNAAPS